MRFEPIPVDDLPPESRAIIEEGMATGLYSVTGLPSSDRGQFPGSCRLMAYNHAVLRATYAQQSELWHQGLLEDRLRELMRIRSAQVNGCDGCAAALKDPHVTVDDVACMVLPGSDRFSPRERAALDVVVKLAVEPERIDDANMASLLELFSPAEVVEVVYYASAMLGQHRFHHVFQSYEPGEPMVSFDPSLIDARHDASAPATT
jgi:alkylhydroperoxidase family enzyme